MLRVGSGDYEPLYEIKRHTLDHRVEDTILENQR